MRVAKQASLMLNDVVEKGTGLAARIVVGGGKPARRGVSDAWFVGTAAISARRYGSDTRRARCR